MYVKKSAVLSRTHDCMLHVPTSAYFSYLSTGNLSYEGNDTRFLAVNQQSPSYTENEPQALTAGCKHVFYNSKSLNKTSIL